MERMSPSRCNGRNGTSAAVELDELLKRPQRDGSNSGRAAVDVEPPSEESVRVRSAPAAASCALLSGSFRLRYITAAAVVCIFLVLIVILYAVRSPRCAPLPAGVPLPLFLDHLLQLHAAIVSSRRPPPLRRPDYWVTADWLNYREIRLTGHADATRERYPLVLYSTLLYTE